MGITISAEEFIISHRSNELSENFEVDKEITMAGRLMSRRIMEGFFAELKDSEGSFQLYINRDEICPKEDKTLYNTVFKKLLDRGDFIGIKGKTFLTKVGEPSVKVSELTILAKTIRPLPAVKTDEDGNVHDAFVDPELRYRMRYVDLVVNDHVKDTFIARSKIIKAIRDNFDAKGWLEVDTPVCKMLDLSSPPIRNSSQH